MSTQTYYGPPIRWITAVRHHPLYLLIHLADVAIPKANSIHRPAEVVPLPTAPTRAEAEVPWHLQRSRPLVSAHTSFFAMHEGTRVPVYSGRAQTSSRVHGVAMTLARAGHGLREAEMRVLDRMPGAAGLGTLTLWCQVKLSRLWCMDDVTDFCFVSFLESRGRCTTRRRRPSWSSIRTNGPSTSASSRWRSRRCTSASCALGQ